MRPLPYAKRIVTMRTQGVLPWLVVLTMGSGGERVLAKVALEGLKDAPRVWVPDDFPIAQAELGWAVGLDILLAPFTAAARATDFVVQIWCARPATLWQLDAGFTATRLMDDWGLARLPAEAPFMPWHPCRAKLDRSFRDIVARARACALLTGDAPLFNDRAFEPARSKLLTA